jgi:heme/copper-type cytochrome/quinol oxidase subunit 2
MWVLFVVLLVVWVLVALAYVGSGKPGLMPGKMQYDKGLRSALMVVTIPLLIWLGVIVFTNHDSDQPGTCGMNGCVQKAP